MQANAERSVSSAGHREARANELGSSAGRDDSLIEPPGPGVFILPLFLGMIGFIVLGVAALVEVPTWVMVGVVLAVTAVMILAVAAWLMWLLSDTTLVLREAVAHSRVSRFSVPPQEGWHQVLVIANRGLDDPALCEEVSRRETRSRTDVMVIAPVVASSWIHSVTGDIDVERQVAQERVDAGLQTLLSKGVKASGHTVDGQPMASLLEGLGEFRASEVVLLNGGEADWSHAGAFAEDVRAQFGLQVTEVNPSMVPLRYAPQALVGD